MSRTKDKKRLVCCRLCFETDPNCSFIQFQNLSRHYFLIHKSSTLTGFHRFNELDKNGKPIITKNIFSMLKPKKPTTIPQEQKSPEKESNSLHQSSQVHQNVDVRSMSPQLIQPIQPPVLKEKKNEEFEVDDSLRMDNILCEAVENFTYHKLLIPFCCGRSLIMLSLVNNKCNLIYKVQNPFSDIKLESKNNEIWLSVLSL